jgi:hypothetical protein
MPVFISALLGGLVNVAGSIAGRVMIALGISVVTFTGFSTTLGWLKTMALTNLQSLPPSIIGLLGVLKVGVCISMLASAYFARLTINGLTGDTVKKWIGK